MDLDLKKVKAKGAKAKEDASAKLSAKLKPRPFERHELQIRLATDPEGLKKFNELVCQIREGVSAALKAARALHKMDEGEYYKFGVSAKTGKPFKSIAEYGTEVMDRARSTVDQYANAGRIADVLENATTVAIKPSNERQLRPLLDLDDNEQIIKTWKKAEVLGGKGGITEPIVRKARQMVVPAIRKVKPVNAAKETLRYQKAGRRLWDKFTPQQKLMFLGDINSWSRALLQELKSDHPAIETAGVESSEQPPTTSRPKVPPPGPATSRQETLEAYRRRMKDAPKAEPGPPSPTPPPAENAGLRKRLLSPVRTV